MKPRWTREDDTRLCRLALEGRTAATIAERLKRSRSAIRRRSEVLNSPDKTESRTETSSKQSTLAYGILTLHFCKAVAGLKLELGITLAEISD